MHYRKFDDRIAQSTAKAKQWAGRLTGDRRLEREGRTAAWFAGVRIKLRDAARRLSRTFRGQSRPGYRSPGTDPLGNPDNGVNPRWRR
jgi:hypothetical protein